MLDQTLTEKIVEAYNRLGSIGAVGRVEKIDLRTVRRHLTSAGVEIFPVRRVDPECPRGHGVRHWTGRQWRCYRCERERSPAKSAQNQRSYRRRSREAAIKAYGGVCACCGEAEFSFLTIDHVDGREFHGHHKSLTGSMLYVWLRKHDWPEGFQVLCWNCNCSRAHNGGVCAHEGQRQT